MWPLVVAKSLIRGLTKSCGCLGLELRKAGLNKKHGEAVVGYTTKEYHAWRNMIDRITDPENKGFENYGGRGIIICQRWLLSYLNFLNDMGRCPPGKSLNRKDNNGNYTPGNCIWSTRIEQANNTSKNHFITLSGQTK